MRFFFLVEIDGPALGFPVHVQVGDFRKPECRGLVEVLQRSEGAAVEQVGFDVGKGPLHFTFRLWAMGAACPGLIPVVRGKRQESGVVNRLVAVIASHHHFHVVVQTGGAQTIEIFEGSHVFPDGGGKVRKRLVNRVPIPPSGVAHDQGGGDQAWAGEVARAFQL